MSQPTEEARKNAYAKGKALYEDKLRTLVEVPENIGKIISIDPESGDYAIADDLIAAGNLVRQRHPNVPMYAARIGYNAVYSFGGARTRRTSA